MAEIENPSVSIQNLSLNYGAVSVLQTLNLDIADGEFIVLLGPSGCGKSTLLNCIAGLLDISKGRIFIKGKNVTWEEPKDRGIGMVFQSYALYPQMTVEKNLSFGLRVAGLPRGEIAKRIARAAEILQIEPLLQRKPSALSGGQRQRVAIGRALVRDVDVFLFDEPLSNLDAKLRSELRVEIKLLHRRLQNTMIYVTHDQIEAMTLADRIAVMKGGVIQQLDAPQTIYNRPVNRFVAGFLGSPAMNFVEGRLEKRGDGWFFVAEDLNIPLGTYQFDGQPEAGPAVFGIRPEHVSLNSGTGWPFSTAANVEVVEPMGSDTLVWLKLAEQKFSVRVTSERTPKNDEAVTVGFDPMRASLFNAETGSRI
ncbi:sn-glycerol-3-phosphate ABC transporter ATP-binding protein UgpC [Mesorhizobium sp. B283B1A]|uniref:ABC transporter ATP-binding protein n=1 Tax=Mesorhizobium TaxID=68287 RepID=UPI0003CE6861|nr:MULTISPECIES: sn-glycerol-3-phosphate ABC transporter ATP-binding protein UgpC [Mesorhizobium]TJV04829.1 MAG: sn-glycerol-3-phosphate ABC transporter ATP-binding protein UgpC [Mesorhizobium sp.]ESY70540.1 ABC transporter ATP-binding protein [Mesorhizobium sp. LNHC232B00]ESY77740.1 ABC transporter ATP-binding protein [Mesorhizobium sp. LNHC221B00]MCA0048437.1 sn-glycerol-3-phosphate ABC transporter ATP-binding protein UgpC [Mesorhizobium sp. B283B1A]TJV37793.1 MAG: sn-glycerol-3-phosphate AB